jgi:hypothetical protein
MTTSSPVTLSKNFVPFTIRGFNDDPGSDDDGEVPCMASTVINVPVESSDMTAGSANAILARGYSSDDDDDEGRDRTLL